MADSTLAALTETTSLAGTDLLYVDNGADRKVKLSTVKTYIGGWRTLKQVNTEQTVVTGTTSKTTSYSVTIPGGTLGTNGRLRVRSTIRYTNTNGNRSAGVDYGGTTFYSFSGLASTNLSVSFSIDIANRNSTSSQLLASATNGSIGLGASGTSDVQTGSVDTTVDQTLTVWVTLASASDTGAVESVLIEYNNDAP